MGGLFKDCGCGCDGAKQKQKFQISLLAALVFFIVANPQTYILVRRILGSRIATPNGNPTGLGLAVHSVVFLLVTWGLMNVTREGFEPAPAPAPTPAEEEEEEEEEFEEEEEEESDEPAPAPADEDEEDDEEEDAPAPSAKKQAEKKILEALEYQAVDTGLRFGSFDSSNELAGPARKLKPMQCGCPDGTSIVVNRK